LKGIALKNNISPSKTSVIHLFNQSEVIHTVVIN